MVSWDVELSYNITYNLDSLHRTGDDEYLSHDIGFEPAHDCNDVVRTTEFLLQVHTGCRYPNTHYKHTCASLISKRNDLIMFS